MPRSDVAPMTAHSTVIGGSGGCRSRDFRRRRPDAMVGPPHRRDPFRVLLGIHPHRFIGGFRRCQETCLLVKPLFKCTDDVSGAESNCLECGLNAVAFAVRGFERFLLPSGPYGEVELFPLVDLVSPSLTYLSLC